MQRAGAIAITAIAGMGGIGKTELALQYALQQRQAGTYPGGIAWLRAREDLGLQIVAFGRIQLGLTLPDDLELAEQVAWCWRHWPTAATLIVFDDVQDYANIQPFLPPQQVQFRVLLTTRRNFGASVQNYEIKVLSPAAGLELLRQLVPDGRIDQDLATTQQVCEWLGYLPLGLELVGRYLARKRDVAVAKLWARLQGQKLAAQALLAAQAGMTASLGVTAAFELSWQELDEDTQLLAALLSLFALADIPWALVQACLPEVDEEALEDLRDAQLVDLSLLTYVGPATYELHQLLREFFAVKHKQMADAKVMKQRFCLVMVAVAEQIPQTPTLAVIAQVTPAIPHLKEAATTLNAALEDEDLTEPVIGIARFYKGQSAFAEAEEWYQHCLAITTQRFGPNHPDVATSLNNLASLYYAQGRYAEAEPLLRQALAIDQRCYGNDHPAVATDLNNLAGLYLAQSRYAEAEPLLRQALAIDQRYYGNDDPAVATDLNNLAELYRAQGRYAEAEPLLRQALDIRQRQLGTDHPEVATSLNNLALLYYAQGRYTEAEPLYGQALTIYQQQLGADHPDVANCLNNLAELHKAQGRYGEAEPLYLQALAIVYQRLGEAHPKTQAGWRNFVGFLLQVAQSDRTAELSDHPMTQGVLRELREGEGLGDGGAIAKTP